MSNSPPMGQLRRRAIVKSPWVAWPPSLGAKHWQVTSSYVQNIHTYFLIENRSLQSGDQTILSEKRRTGSYQWKDKGKADHRASIVEEFWNSVWANHVSAACMVKKTHGKIKSLDGFQMPPLHEPCLWMCFCHYSTSQCSNFQEVHVSLFPPFMLKEGANGTQNAELQGWKIEFLPF